MKRTIVMITIALTTFGAAPSSFAMTFNKSMGIISQTIEGIAFSLNKANNTIFIMDKDDKKFYVVGIRDSDLLVIDLKRGYIKVTLRPGSNLAYSIK